MVVCCPELEPGDGVICLKSFALLASAQLFSFNMPSMTIFSEIRNASIFRCPEAKTGSRKNNSISTLIMAAKVLKYRLAKGFERGIFLAIFYKPNFCIIINFLYVNVILYSDTFSVYYETEQIGAPYYRINETLPFFTYVCVPFVLILTTQV